MAGDNLPGDTSDGFVYAAGDVGDVVDVVDVVDADAVDADAIAAGPATAFGVYSVAIFAAVVAFVTIKSFKALSSCFLVSTAVFNCVISVGTSFSLNFLNLSW